MTQNEALAILKTGANVFLTGEPGSGKTHTINLYIKYLREHKVQVAVTASTGIAATHLGGMTIHSFSGIGIKKELSNADISQFKNNDRLGKRALKTKVLVIDEISMLDAQTLNAINTALKTLRDNDAPFGGLQIIFVGDFFQLPPVSPTNSQVQFSFSSPAWQQASPVVCYLSEQHRQDDERFLSLLGSIRNQTFDENIYELLQTRKAEVETAQTTTHLYSHNVDVDRVNSQKLACLAEKEVSFQMTSHGAKPLVEKLKKNCLSPQTLVLKKGALIMFTKNSYSAYAGRKQGFVNGTLGKVVKFTDNAPVVETLNGRTIKVSPMQWEINDGLKSLASITQLPLRLAWAITVHKSQGMTLDAAVIDLSQAFEYGQGYVALSRVRSLSGLFLLGLNTRALEVHPAVSQADLEFRKQSEKSQSTLDNYSQTELSQKHNKFVSLKKSTSVSSTYDQTLSLFKKSLSIAKIAEARSLKQSTIVSHLEELKSQSKLTPKDLQIIIPNSLKNNLPIIQHAFAQNKDQKLTPVLKALKKKYSYHQLRLARLTVPQPQS